MATFTSFEDIEAWQLARELSQTIWILTNVEPFKSDFALKGQINKSTGSIMDNIAEGFGRGGTKEFIQFIGIALGSLAETKSQLLRAKDRGYIDDDKLNRLLEMNAQIGNKLGRLTKYLQESELKGIKYKARG